LEEKMTKKFWFRSVRNVMFRNRPYFAHLALTHVCNLRCSFCHIPEEKVKEEDTAGMKRIIDKLDRMGIAVLSISGGGEPLLRSDFATVLNYAADKGLYVKITSNGTMSQKKYAELLATRITEIAISLDGVTGNQLPFAHVGPKVLDSIRFLDRNLPKGKQLTLNITISQSNCDQVEEIIDYCTREFPRTRLWLNPVVVGDGKLRVKTEQKVNPEFLRRVKSPNLLTPRFYKEGCEEYYRSETYNWGCLAGEFFFDIKPNGDFWICQDHPSKTPLNILDSDFELKRRKADFSNRRQCSGCTYSCYWITQKSFEPRSWPDMAVVWWNCHTRPNEPCRQTAEKHGWVAGLMHFWASRAFHRNTGALSVPAAAAVAQLDSRGDPRRSRDCVTL
jgi:MoaA/NifB/PqqE/SkfB family radical SAM enzyme